VEINKIQQKVTALVRFVRKSKKAFRGGTAERPFVKWPNLLLGGFVAVFAGGIALIVGSGGIEAAVAFEPLAGSKYNK
jgi:hypothetical protein